MTRNERITHNRAISRATDIIREKSLACSEAANTCKAVGMEKEAEHLTVLAKAFSCVVKDVRELLVQGSGENDDDN